MNLHQFRFVQEAVRRNLNLTETAKALYTSQPGISKAILELEEELGVDIFVRHGKRLKRVTEPGMQVLKSVDLILREVANLKRIGEEYSKQDSGRLSIAATHTQARYVLPEPVAQLRKRFPKVQVTLHQGTPDQVAQMLMSDQADIGLATESLADYEELVTLPCYEWQHVIVMAADHPLAAQEEVSLAECAANDLVVLQADRIELLMRPVWARHQLKPRTVLRTSSLEAVRSLVGVGAGLAVLPDFLYRPWTLDAEHVEVRTLRDAVPTVDVGLVWRRGTRTREVVQEFIEMAREQSASPRRS